MPLIRIEPVENPEMLDTALQDAATGRIAWIIFTSVNAVEAVAARLEVTGAGPVGIRRIANRHRWPCYDRGRGARWFHGDTHGIGFDRVGTGSRNHC